MTDRDRLARVRADVTDLARKRLWHAEQEPPAKVANQPWLQAYLADVEALLAVIDGMAAEGGREAA